MKLKELFFKGERAIEVQPQKSDEPEQSTAVAAPEFAVPPKSTFFHITHHKAASQWMLGIFKELFGPVVVKPEYHERHIWDRPIQSGRVYSCCYMGKPEFDTLEVPETSRAFVIIRDLRDTLVSAYFSLGFTHELKVDGMDVFRNILNRLGPEGALLYLAEGWLVRAARIQRTWLNSEVPCFKLEDFFSDAPRMLGCMFDQGWGLKVPQGQLDKVAEHHSFFQLSGGRQPGQENVASHYRKGTAGDWRNHFTPRVAERFEQLYNDVLLLAGYEQQPGWSQQLEHSTRESACAPSFTI
ncbi:MAG TPA: sulfotransferase domain-containing protein [Verrucomicrobiae bacterium]|nr:sulfotransferase domain-containing protein [Verrucomicrobiae bacterium]